MSHKRISLVGCMGALAMGVAMVAASCNSTSGTSTTTNTIASTTPAITSSAQTTVPKTVTLDLTAKNLSFDKTALTVPAGAAVTLSFSNQDTGIPHNFAAYTNSGGSTSIFVGQTINGPGTVTYKFPAPATPGTYFFRCDVHPSMTGSLVVTP